MYLLCYDCIFVTESWLSTKISNGLVDPENKYTVLRKDRSSAKGGGVCALIKNCHSVAPVQFADKYSQLEIVAFDILDMLSVVRVFVVYRPPNYSTDAHEYAGLLTDCFKTYTVKNGSNVVTGDFNLPNINWNSLHCPDEHIHKLVFNFVISHGFAQIVNFPTRELNTLDLVFTDDDCLITDVKSCPPLGLSDHSSVQLTLTVFSVDSVKSTDTNDALHHHHRYLWRRGDYENMACYLASVDWYSVICHYPSAECMWKSFVDLLWSAVRLFVPLDSRMHDVTKRINKPTKSRSLRKCAIRKLRLWNQIQKHPHNLKLRSDYRECVHKWRHILRCEQANKEQRIVDANNVGMFYRFVNNRITNRTCIGAVMDNGEIITDNLDKANAFNSYFSTAGISDNGVVPQCMNITLTSVIDSVTINESDVLSSIGRLKNTLSAGPDNLPPFLFKKLKHCLSKPLAILFTQLVSVGHVPSDWLKAVIVPVFKKGVAGKLCNYRPISLTCVPSKILERVLVQAIYAHLCNNSILHPSQHGFCKRRSTTTNLLDCFNDWTMTILSKEQHVVVYVDFSKAFDVVSHPKLFARLHSYGIRDTLLNWLVKFFTGRSHCTKIGTAMSDFAVLLSGVVQGSGIGPLMFLTYINELVFILEKHNIKVKLFADDVKMYIKIVNDVDMQQLQLAINALTNWAHEWQLGISVDKCCVLNIGTEVIAPCLYLNNCKLSVLSQTRDLGITVCNSLSPTAHVMDIVSKAHRRAALILRAFTSQNIELLMRAYVVYVRPLLEHNTVIWSPYTVNDIEAIEQVQRRFTKRLRGYGNYSYPERLRHLKLHSLEVRRLVIDLVWCYKIVFNVVDNCMEEFFSFSNCTSTRGHSYKLYKRQFSTSTRAHFFSERVINIWNALPADVIDFSSVKKFRYSVSKVDFSSFTKCF